MNISEIHKREKDRWKKANINFFGVTVANWQTLTAKEIQAHLDKDTKKYWNHKEYLKYESYEKAKQNGEDYKNCQKGEKPCEMAYLIFKNVISRDSDKLTDKGIELEFNNISESIDIYGYYNMPRTNKEERKIIASIPAPCPDLTWLIRGTKWVARITATRDYQMIHNEGNLIKKNKGIKKPTKNNPYPNNLWVYSKKNGFIKGDLDKAFENCKIRDFLILQAALSKSKKKDINEINKSNFLEALNSLEAYEYNSIYHYRFLHLDGFFDMVRGERKYANPLGNIALGVSSFFLKQAENAMEKTGTLVISTTPVYSLENFRSLVYIPIKYNNKNTFVPSFTFSHTRGLLDAFKTSTSGSAGRHRLLLDDIYLKEDWEDWFDEKKEYLQDVPEKLEEYPNILYYKDKNKKERNMYETINHKSKNKDDLSMISSSLFCNNNQPKRIMMTSKLTAQSIPVEAEVDELTNRVPARVVFGEFEGWTYADSIIISESFAKKLAHKNKESIILENIDEVKDFLESSRIKEWNKEQPFELLREELTTIWPNMNKSILSDYKGASILEIEELSKKRKKIIIEYEIPFTLGDKITNLHGSKGVVGHILPDNEMPELVNDIGNFKAGPFEVIISGYSVLRRGSLGQIFEAWATATGRELEFQEGEDYARTAIEKYGKEMKEFSDASLVRFGKNKESVMPCGVIDMIRLYHHASTKTSFSYLKSNYNRMLSFGEQEKLNLAANGMFNVLKEFSIRSTHKHTNSIYHIKKLRETKKLPKKSELKISSDFARILKSMGYSLILNGKELVKTSNIGIKEQTEIDIAKHLKDSEKERHEESDKKIDNLFAKVFEVEEFMGKKKLNEENLENELALIFEKIGGK